LHHAHTLKIKGAPAGIVHRDVSSQNVLVDVETGMARLIDFGIAKSELGDLKTEIGLLKGKVIYMAPEILRGAKPSPRIDIYAVGVLLYAVLTGRLPFTETDDIWAARIAGRYPRPSQVRPDLSAAIDRIIHRALHPDPERRYQTAAEFAADLEAEV